MVEMVRKEIFDDNFAVYDNGTIKKINDGVEIDAKISTGGRPDGYFIVSANGKPYMVHRLIAEAFIPNPKNKPVVNHIDGNKQNNAASNLEWVTRIENSYHAYVTGLSQYSDGLPKEATPLKARRCALGITQADAAQAVQVAQSTLSNWELGKTFPPIRKAKMLAKLYGCKTTDFYNRTT